MFLNIIETSFPVIYLSNGTDKLWITKGIKMSCQHKQTLYIISGISDDLKLYYKNYYSILRRVITDAKKNNYKHLIETSENQMSQNRMKLCLYIGNF
jgi:hypothetical protein